METKSSKQDRVQITFDNLEFRKPYTDNSLKRVGEKTFFSGLVLKSGVYVVRYVNKLGVLRYKFNAVVTSLYSSAFYTYSELTRRGATQLEFAFVPEEKRKHSRILKTLKKSFFLRPLDNHYRTLKPWLDGVLTKSPPIKLFNFRKIFSIEDGRLKNFCFNDYRNRAGVYILRRKKKIVHVGKGTRSISDIVRNHFYRNRHVNYYLDAKKGYYDATIIEVPRYEGESEEKHKQRISDLERILQKFYLPNTSFGTLQINNLTEEDPF